jgi:predicted secreted hydrolase
MLWIMFSRNDPALIGATSANSHRRRLLRWLAAAPWAAGAPVLAGPAPDRQTPRALVFPTDHGAHADSRIEWWYVTGELHAGAASTVRTDEPTHGFQITFFRSRTEVAADQPSRFAAKQLLFAHAALSDLKAGRLLHDQRIARTGFGIAHSDADDTAIVLRDWRLGRQDAAAGSRYQARVRSDSAGFAFDFNLNTSQSVLLQGDAGYSLKGPQQTGPTFSRYYTQPQLAVSGTLTRQGTALPVRGTAWLDHEWSDSLLPPGAVGWDWIGMNLADGSALTAFRLRAVDGRTVYAGGSLRGASGAFRNFAADEVSFTPHRVWTSPSSQAKYPVEWTLQTPAGLHRIVALLDAQELDSRQSTGTIYWEGISELRDEQGQRIGRGYLEMTGYAGALRL